MVLTQGLPSPEGGLVAKELFAAVVERKSGKTMVFSDDGAFVKYGEAFRMPAAPAVAPAPAAAAAPAPMEAEDAWPALGSASGAAEPKKKGKWGKSKQRFDA